MRECRCLFIYRYTYLLDIVYSRKPVVNVSMIYMGDILSKMYIFNKTEFVGEEFAL